MKRFLPAAVVLVLVTALYLSGGLGAVERGLMDVRFWLTARSAQSDLVLVTIDPRSLETLNVWPWPRGYHATVVENLLDAGARRVAFDIDFSSRSVAEEDLEFERALAAADPQVVLPVFQQWERDAAGEYRLDESGPMASLRQHAVLATINVKPSPGGLVRRYLSSGEFSGEEVPSLALALADVDAQRTESFFIDFGIAADSIQRISYLDVLTGLFEPERVEGRVVVVGSTALELGDQIAVPRYAALPGPVVQAMAYESIFQGRTLREITPFAVVTIAVAIAVLLGPWLSQASWRRGLVVVLGGSAAVFVVSVAAQQWTPHVLEISPWVAVLTGVYAYALVSRIDRQTLRLVAQGLRIRRTEHVMHHVVDHSFDAILTVLDDDTVENFNRAAEKIFRCPAASVLGRPITELLAAGPDAARGASIDVQPGPYEALALRRDGTSISVEVAVTRMTIGDEPRRVLFVRDITERKAQQRQLEHQATHDALTNLPNRYLLARRVEQALTYATEDNCQVAFLLLDLDRFKEVNDTLGHQTGDIVLREIAKRLTASLRPRDTIARLGGDEFAVLLPDTDVETARTVAGWLARSLDAPFNVRDLNLHVEASAGIAVFPDHGSDAETLIQRADVAMYVAKRTRSTVEVYDEEKDFTSVRQLLLTGELGEAIDKDQLVLHYQPKISAITETVVSVEALVRWRHAEHGVIPPDEFIGLAEHSGLIRPLTTWVLQVGLLQCAEWRRLGLDLGIAVNVSTQNLLEGDLVGLIERTLVTAELAAPALTLEITESAIMMDPQRALEVVTELDRLGVRISIDDFGTGYSSLGYLKKLPAKEIKIDKSFTLEMNRNPSDTMIVRSTIELAQNLGLEVVVEGVETEEVWHALKALGCDYGQGFLFSEPVPAETLTESLRLPKAASS